MSLVVGSVTLSDGSRSQPYRTTDGSGSRSVSPSRPIRSDAKIHDRKGRLFEETVEVDYSYESAAAARAGWVTRRAAALAQAKGTYSDGSTTIGSALIDNVKLVWLEGCGLTIAYHIIGEIA